MNYTNILQQAAQLFDNNMLDEAENLLRSIEQTLPDNPYVLNLLGLIAQKKGLHNQACSYFEAAIRQKNDSAEFYYNLAFSLKETSQLHDALINFKKVISIIPTLKEAYNEIACIYEKLQSYSIARDWWHKALNFDSSYHEALINLANSYAYEDIDLAISKLSELKEVCNREYLLWLNLAWLTHQKSDYQTAIEYAKKSHELNPFCADTNYILGFLYYNISDYQQSLNYSLEVIKFNPNHVQNLLILANIYSSQQNFSQAEKHYKRIIELKPKSFEAHHNYAEMLYRQNRIPEALEEYRSAILINPKSSSASNNLGVILKDTADYDEALGLFFNALTLTPSSEETSINIAETLVLLSRIDYQKSCKIASNWLKSYPKNIFAIQTNAALKGEKIENNQIYVERLFDNFADNYELVMQNLDYSAPLAIQSVAGDICGTVADLGCGTGLVGQAVKSVQNQIIGVDISANMLQVAAQKNIYKELIKSDIISFLQLRKDYDWIIAADVVGYLGDLTQFIQLCFPKKLIFSIEIDNNIKDYQLDATSRYKHNPEYINNLLIKAGYKDINTQKIKLRNENNTPVDAMVFFAK